uniref:Uncharacterized protein n=1 Tax=Palpitomonas bilix TaxID=652834 RepID=A0A7S3GLD9_9EUKA|mmetsp:Transcript_834/g.1544  ORF Transcript_834/g.1544 Transcript_834/m.1544 type:complete len:153 (+) Transcript_834:122-580(+)
MHIWRRSLRIINIDREKYPRCTFQISAEMIWCLQRDTKLTPAVLGRMHWPLLIESIAAYLGKAVRIFEERQQPEHQRIINEIQDLGAFIADATEKLGKKLTLADSMKERPFLTQAEADAFGEEIEEILQKYELGETSEEVEEGGETSESDDS